MAKTALFSKLQNQFRQHARAHAQGISVAELRERDARAREVNRDRRKFLGAAAASAAIVPLSMVTPRPARAAGGPRIAIIGGGIAGLSCALRLADHGIASTVYEASQRAGGRMFTNRAGWNDAQVSEWGGELIDTGHRTIRRLARRFGLTLDDLLEAQPRDAQETYYFGGAYYTEAQADRDFAQFYDRVVADLKAAPFPTTYDNFTAHAAMLDHMSVYDWIETRVPGGHRSPMGQLLDVAYAIEYAADTTDQSALNILYLLGFQPDSSGKTFAKFGESDERFHIRGGNDQLPGAIAAQLGLGCCVRLGMRLQGLKRAPGGNYRLSFDNGNRATEIGADLVVLALPFAVLRELDFDQAGFDSLKRQAITELGRGVAAKLQLQFRRRIWNGRGGWPGVSSGSSNSDTGYQEGWDVTRAQAGRSGILCFFSGGSVAAGAFTTQAFGTAASALVAADAARGLTQIEPVFPGLSAQWNGKATQSLWHRHPNYRLAYSYYRVGQYTRFGGYEQATQGGVYFCGEHTSTDFQGFMEGGAEQGVRAARQIIRRVQGRDVAEA